MRRVLLLAMAGAGCSTAFVHELAVAPSVRARLRLDTRCRALPRPEDNGAKPAASQAPLTQRAAASEPLDEEVARGGGLLAELGVGDGALGALLREKWPQALILLCAAIYGTNFACVKLLGDAIPAAHAAALRFALAAAALAPFAASASAPGALLAGFEAGT